MQVTHSRSEALFKFSDKVKERLLKQVDLVRAGPESNESTKSTTKILTRVFDGTLLQGREVSQWSDRPLIRAAYRALVLRGSRPCKKHGILQRIKKIKPESVRIGKRKNVLSLLAVRSRPPFEAFIRLLTTIVDGA